MATRSRIGILDGEQVKSVYCHWDGYPDFVGHLLNSFYKDTNRINLLMELGNLSSLAPKINPDGEHSFITPEKDVCVFYGRDRGQEGEECITESLDSYVGYAQDDWTEYRYLYKDDKWFHISKWDKNGLVETP